MTISFSQGQVITPESNNQLTLKFGGYSNKGIRDENQDAIIVKHPKTRTEQELKGSVACIADGASCSEHGQKASHTSVMLLKSMARMSTRTTANHYQSQSSGEEECSLEKLLVI